MKRGATKQYIKAAVAFDPDLLFIQLCFKFLWGAEHLPISVLGAEHLPTSWSWELNTSQHHNLGSWTLTDIKAPRAEHLPISRF